MWVQPLAWEFPHVLGTELLQFSPLIMKILLLSYFYNVALLCKAKPACSPEVDLEMCLFIFNDFIIFQFLYNIFNFFFLSEAPEAHEISWARDWTLAASLATVAMAMPDP